MLSYLEYTKNYNSYIQIKRNDVAANKFVCWGQKYLHMDTIRLEIIIVIVYGRKKC